MQYLFFSVTISAPLFYICHHIPGVGGNPPLHLSVGKECNKHSRTEGKLGNSMLTHNTELDSRFQLTRTNQMKPLMLCNDF